MEVEYGVGITNRFAYLNVDDVDGGDVVLTVPVKKTQVTPKQSKPKVQPVPEVRTVKPEVKPAAAVLGKKAPTGSLENRNNTARAGNPRQFSDKERSGPGNKLAEMNGDDRKFSKGRGEFGRGRGEGDVAKHRSGTRIFEQSGAAAGRTNRGQYGRESRYPEGQHGRDSRYPEGQYGRESRYPEGQHGRDSRYQEGQRDYRYPEGQNRRDGRSRDGQHGKDKVDGQRKSFEKKDDAEKGTADQIETEESKDKDDKENENLNEDGNKDNKEETEAPKVVEPEPITFTLSEWKALQASREKPMFNTRKPGEGESKLQKLVPAPVKKEATPVEPESEEEEREEVHYPQRAGKQKHISDLGFKFETTYDKRRGGGGRFERGDRRPGGGEGRSPRFEKKPEQTSNIPRGGGRGRNPRGEGRGNKSVSSPAPRIDDTADFPKLG